MKKLVLVALLCFVESFAQQKAPSAGDYSIKYTYNGKQNKITLLLPKDAEIKADGKFVIKGNTFHIEEDEASYYLNDDEKKSPTDKEKKITTMTSFWASKNSNKDNAALKTQKRGFQMRSSEDNEFMICWHTRKKMDNAALSEFMGGKVIGNQIFVLVMEGDAATKTLDLTENQNLFFEILDSASPEIAGR
ncbi:MAG: hypothetical protein ACOVRN_12730 [Flavobacterium sp.]